MAMQFDNMMIGKKTLVCPVCLLNMTASSDISVMRWTGISLAVHERCFGTGRANIADAIKNRREKTIRIIL